MKILIDSMYIHNGGGKEIIGLLIDYILYSNLEKNFFFILDERLEINNLILKKINYKRLNPGEFNRREFYNKNNFVYYHCLANIPPPIQVSSKSSVYFHNDLFLNPINSNLGLINIIKNIIKKSYIRLNSKKTYEWIVQTNLMKEKLNQIFYIPENKIHVHPIFDPIKIKSKKIDSSFLYVCNSSKHKNHKRLMDAFIKAAKKIKDKIHLKLTLSKDDFIKSEYNRENMPTNLFIENIGIVGKEKLSNLYLESKFLIFPSLNESLGLPLIEAVNRDCFIIASPSGHLALRTTSVLLSNGNDCSCFMLCMLASIHLHLC